MTRFPRLFGFVLLPLVAAMPVCALADDPAVPAAMNVASVGPNTVGATGGLVSLNIAAGTANAQSNSVIIGLRAVDLGDIHATVPAPASTASPSADRATISPSAFSGSSGIVQVNATAGTSNTSSNAFSLSILPAGGH